MIFWSALAVVNIGSFIVFSSLYYRNGLEVPWRQLFNNYVATGVMYAYIAVLRFALGGFWL